MGHLTGRHIDLVMKGNGYNHICFCGAGSIQHIWIGAVSDKASDVKNIANPLNECRLIVDYGDIVIFGMTCLHATLDNLTPDYRLSLDMRFQSADEPVDPRFQGQHPLAHSGRDKTVVDFFRGLKKVFSRES